MNKFSKIAAVAMFGFAAMGANAAVATGTFDVTINLTPTCSVSTGTNVALNYTSFGAAQSGSTSLNIKCTNTLPYTAALSGVTTIAGIAFTVTPAAALPTAGTGANQTVALDVSAIAGQSGTCAAAAGCTGTATQTLTVTY
jgi:spore coat protein U-like protein